MLPLCFVVLSLLAFAGGALYQPSNYDALAYRTPRVLHWLAEAKWHWIHTDFARLNTRGCGMEWVTAPLIAFTGTDRFLFLINVVCFALLPGRVFSVLTRLGVTGRTAWSWMWLLPTGYCYLLQAGSIGNDLFGALFALAAIEMALRGRQSQRPAELWLSLIAAGLMTAGKAFNLLLLLPWAIAIWPCLGLSVRTPVVSVLVMLIAAGSSLLPTAWLNLRHCGDWTGMKAEQVANLGGHAPVFRVVVNSALITLHNFTPTIFPLANEWNEAMERVIPRALATTLKERFEPAGAGFQVGEMQMEESAGLGFGLSLVLAGLLIRRRSSWWAKVRTLGWHQLLIPLAAWAGVVIFMAGSGLSCPARYLAPFYILLVAPLLWQSVIPGRASSLGVFVLAAILLVVSPARPLWPAVTVLRARGADQSAHPLVQRAWRVYSVYGVRGDAFAPAKALLPANTYRLGVITSDDPETSLWRPFGSRRVIHISRTDTPEEIRKEGVRYVLASSRILTQNFQLSLDELLARYHAKITNKISLDLRAGTGSQEWFLLELL
jgi:hypothetical protein